MALSEALANSSALTFMPKMVCGSGTVRVPASSVVTSKLPSLMRLKGAVLAPIISAAALAGPARAAPRGRLAAPANRLRRFRLGFVMRALRVGRRETTAPQVCGRVKLQPFHEVFLLLTRS